MYNVQCTYTSDVTNIHTFLSYIFIKKFLRFNPGFSVDNILKILTLRTQCSWWIVSTLCTSCTLCTLFIPLWTLRVHTFHVLTSLGTQRCLVIVSPTFYPRFVVNYDFSYVFHQNGPTHFRISKISGVPQTKFVANCSRGSWVMIGQTNKQTNRNCNFIYIEDKINNVEGWIERE